MEIIVDGDSAYSGGNTVGVFVETDALKNFSGVAMIEIFNNFKDASEYLKKLASGNVFGKLSRDGELFIVNSEGGVVGGAEIERLKHDISAKNKQISELELSLKHTKDSLQRKVDFYESELASLQRRIGSYKSELASLQSQKDTYQSELASLKNNIDSEIATKVITEKDKLKQLTIELEEERHELAREKKDYQLKTDELEKAYQFKTDELEKALSSKDFQLAVERNQLADRADEINLLKEAYSKKFGAAKVQSVTEKVYEGKTTCQLCEGSGGARGGCRKCDGTGWTEKFTTTTKKVVVFDDGT